MRLPSVALILCVVACGSSSGGTSPAVDSGVTDTASHDVVQPAADSGSGSDATGEAGTGYPAPHPPMPEVTDLGGPVMTAPKFVVITFAGDSMAAQIDDFASKVASSTTYWSGTTAEYGVGPVASVLDISVAETPAANLADSDVQAWLAAKLAGPEAGTLEGGAPWPQPDVNTLYMIYYPSGVSISQGGGTSCNQFYGYHDDFAFSGGYVTYSVIARCASFPGTSAIDSIAAIASHEFVEAATDPQAQDHPAYYQPDADHAAWGFLGGGEVGDMCASFGNVFYKPTDLPYLVQRTWSNKAAAASLDPCEPDGVMPNFNAAAVLNDSVTVGGAATKGVKIAAGATGSVTLDLYSSGPTSGPWSVQAVDGLSYVSMGGSPAELSLSFAGGTSDTATGKNGDKLTLNIKVLTADPSGGEVFLLVSTLGTSMTAPQTYWVGLVGQQ
jgi:hypothetical protein